MSGSQVTILFSTKLRPSALFGSFFASKNKVCDSKDSGIVSARACTWPKHVVHVTLHKQVNIYTVYIYICIEEGISELSFIGYEHWPQNQTCECVIFNAIKPIHDKHGYPWLLLRGWKTREATFSQKLKWEHATTPVIMLTVEDWSEFCATDQTNCSIPGPNASNLRNEPQRTWTKLDQSVPARPFPALLLLLASDPVHWKWSNVPCSTTRSCSRCYTVNKHWTYQTWQYYIAKVWIMQTDICSALLALPYCIQAILPTSTCQFMRSILFTYIIIYITIYIHINYISYHI